MAYDELSQAVPPAYASLIAGEAVMHTLRTRFGLPVIRFDEMRANVGWARSMMQLWRRGAGGSSPSLPARPVVQTAVWHDLGWVTARSQGSSPALRTLWPTCHALRLESSPRGRPRSASAPLRCGLGRAEGGTRVVVPASAPGAVARQRDAIGRRKNDDRGRAHSDDRRRSGVRSGDASVCVQGRRAFHQGLAGVRQCALICGHLELVPNDEVEWALAHGSVHPLTVVHQSADKWRSCQDYKAGTNHRVISEPFSLCTAHEVAHVVRPDSHFAKFDLRDGFWSVPVAPSSRHHLMVRHPATGRLLRCTSLPFGFSKSPQHFCRVTEAVAAKFRERVGGLGIHCFCFVDDFLVCGDTKDLTVQGMKAFMALLEELGLPFAPHKTRGPARVIEFLGFLLSNVEGARCVALTESRQAKMQTLIDEWMAMEPPPGGEVLMVKPVELASLLGQFVFASEAIPNGRVYMQAMLRQFKGVEVDWARGLVRHLSSQWSLVRIHDGFWRDLHWWRSALRRQNCMPFAKPTVGEVAVIGTDASDLACGELFWIDGAREETMLMFTEAERRRPINFRELRGTLRAFEMWGPRICRSSCAGSTSCR